MCDRLQEWFSSEGKLLIDDGVAMHMHCFLFYFIFCPSVQSHPPNCKDGSEKGCRLGDFERGAGAQLHDRWPRRNDERRTRLENMF